jgi:DNA-binding NarL/FixJ family response regulator
VEEFSVRARILIADDSPLVRKSIRRLLETNPEWEVCGEAANGQEAINQAMVLTPDIIVLDLVMPVMDGLQAARRMAVIAPKVPTVMLTMYASDQLRTQASEIGIQSVVSKSQTSSLMDTIETVLARRDEMIGRQSVRAGYHD